MDFKGRRQPANGRDRNAGWTSRGGSRAFTPALFFHARSRSRRPAPARLHILEEMKTGHPVERAPRCPKSGAAVVINAQIDPEKKSAGVIGKGAGARSIRQDPPEEDTGPPRQLKSDGTVKIRSV